MEQSYLKERTKSFASEIIKLVESLPNRRTADVIGRQLFGCWYASGSELPGCVQSKITSRLYF
jgi:hypothetical protein